MVQDNEKVNPSWAFVIDDRPSEIQPHRTAEEQKAYERERDEILASIDFNNL